MTRWESNMVEVARGYLDAGSTRAARDILTAILRAQAPEDPKPVKVWVLDGPRMPQDAPEAVPARPIPPDSLQPQALSPTRSAGASGELADSWAEPL